MQLNFLSARVPLTKAYSRNPDGTIEKSNYPLVGNFTSYSSQVETPKQFYDALNEHAAKAHCLLKGLLATPLEDESRANSTNNLDKTEWVCFDLDGVRGFIGPDDFIRQVLPDIFHDVTYITQHSASDGITGPVGTRIHIFFLLEDPILPDLLKLWLTDLNLQHPVLSEQLELSANATTLRYPLDRTVNQNDKLIYIAPPLLSDNITDPFPNGRIHLHSRGKQRVALNITIRTPPAVQRDVDERCNQLRELHGLKKKTAKYKVIGTTEILANPDTAIVTGEKSARGWVYLNVNTGDSWAYYYNPQYPRFLHNFKGEPSVILRDFLPSYWAELQQRAAAGQADALVNLPERPFIFRDPTTDTYHNGLYDAVNNRISLLAKTTGGKKAADFFAQYGLDVPDPIEDWTYTFDPTNDQPIDFTRKFCNMWQPSELIRTAKPNQEMPPLIKRILFSVVGNDELCFERLINWLACIYQFRTKMLTAWVLQGVEGTGKGTLFSKILMPIFGTKHCSSKLLSQIEDQFNADFETCLILHIDEVSIESAHNSRRMISKLKNMITEPHISIRAMRTDAVMRPNFANLIFASNQVDAMEIAPSDRRFNVAPRQETKISLTASDMTTITEELPQFTGYLAGYPADLKLAQTAIDNEAKRQMRSKSQDALEQMCQAILDGNLSYFAQYTEISPGASPDIVRFSVYQEIVHRWAANVGTPIVVSREDILAVYLYLHAPPREPGPQKFQRMLEHKNLVANNAYTDTNGLPTRGLMVTWQATPEDLEKWKPKYPPHKAAHNKLVHAA